MTCLFQEDERLSVQNGAYLNEEREITTYQTSRANVLLRLDVMGVTLDQAKQDFEVWLAEKRRFYEELEWAKETRDALASFSLEEWMRRVPGVLRKRYETDRGEPKDEIEREMLDSSYDGGWLFFSSSDARYVYRLILEACPEVEKITLDISDLVIGGYLDRDVRLCAEARAPDAMERPILEPVIIMGEGKTDIRVLQESLNALYPSVREMFSFFDHDTLNVDGGANFLLKFLKALSAARMPLRIIAIFDNDAAGNQEFESAKSLALPTNVTVMRLPDIPLARSYPTIGPQGEHRVDINGRAVGIELFMGQHNLLDAEGRLRPVRWTHYYSATDTYQGEVSDKALVQKAFFEDIRLRRSPNDARIAYSELDLLWQTVFAALR